jgi:hypothetical protein
VNQNKCTPQFNYSVNGMVKFPVDERKRPHWGLSLETPEQKPDTDGDGEIVRVAKLGGLINEYHRIAA